MPEFDPYGFSALDEAVLEAEVATSALDGFAQKYRVATDDAINPGDPIEYQEQPNKWGPELRIYFNSHIIDMVLRGRGVHVEEGRPYRPNHRYRINNNNIWWELVEHYGFKLGRNSF